ncbi:hypothetical protein G2W53_008518 [Senna tora]|uniref:Uncharacterized protein n=1 Tax=Senna tora TaxID=362788 RepID=A0A834X7Z7_9FABA|nr:hypothetical protein G2W53_008518 [Senna tora]
MGQNVAQNEPEHPLLPKGGKEGEGMNGVKEAVGKSFDKSKETVKGAAESAAQVVHSTAQKIKSNTPSASASEQESKAEL